jgi:hypothetical protein
MFLLVWNYSIVEMDVLLPGFVLKHRSLRQEREKEGEVN